MRNYIMIIFACWLSAAIKAQGQEVVFISPAVEEGIRQHLNITNGAAISFSQLDTISTLDLSKRGITDIRDLVLMPNLRTLDLSDNAVDDLQPLTLLDSLEWVDLSYNYLKSINDLFVSSAKKLTINVAFNYIKDFSLFSSISLCDFVLEGTGLQMDENALYFDVYHFYADIDEEGVPLVRYRGFTNMENNVTLACGSTQMPAVMNGETYRASLSENLSVATKAILSNSIVGDTTWVVPVIEREIQSGEEITVETGLPEDYTIGSIYGKNGEVSVEKTAISYKASSAFDYDELLYSYYDELSLRGFSKIVLKSKETPTDIVVATEGQRNVEIQLQGNQLNVKCNAMGLADEAMIDVFDLSGRIITSERVSCTNGIDARIPLPTVPRNVIVVSVTSGSKRFVDKISVK